MGNPTTWLVKTQSSQAPPPDENETRWRRHPVLALTVRLVALIAPLAASVVVGILASREFRPRGWPATIAWGIWTAAASLLTLWIVDVAARRLLPLHRLLQLCLAFPDRAPSRVRIAVRAARSHRPEAILVRSDVPPSAADAAEHVVTMLAALAMHDQRSRGHSERVCAYAGLLAEQMHLPQDERDRISWVALIHDIGKLHVPARLLNKPGKPTVAEWHVLQAHPERGAAIVEPLREWLGPAADAVMHHHEQYDGGGYPHGISGDDISFAARLIAVVDAFEVMTSPRAYRRPVDAQAARAELARHAGQQFDPHLVREFLAVGLPELRRAMGPVAWVAEIPFISSWPRLEAATSNTAAHAATATAAASTAGLLAIAAGGGVTAAQASPTPSLHVHDAIVGPTAHLDVHPVADAHQVQLKSAPARPQIDRLETPPAAGPTLAHVAHPAKSTTTSVNSQAGTDASQHHAYGHEHAPGWLKNWGPQGRQRARHSDHGHHGND